MFFPAVTLQLTADATLIEKSVYHPSTMRQWLLSRSLKVVLLLLMCLPKFEGQMRHVASALHKGETKYNASHADYEKVHVVKWPLDALPPDHEHEQVVLMEVEESAQEEGSKDGNSAVGSKPPSCISKCGTCKPCKPVRVPVPPGSPTISEYYPEAWRCKCGGKLYMP